MLPSLVMVSNPSVNYMLYEYLRSRLEDWRRVASSARLTHTAADHTVMHHGSACGRAGGVHCTDGLLRQFRRFMIWKPSCYNGGLASLCCCNVLLATPAVVYSGCYQNKGLCHAVASPVQRVILLPEQFFNG